MFTVKDQVAFIAQQLVTSSQENIQLVAVAAVFIITIETGHWTADKQHCGKNSEYSASLMHDSHELMRLRHHIIVITMRRSFIISSLRQTSFPYVPTIIINTTTSSSSAATRSIHRRRDSRNLIIAAWLHISRACSPPAPGNAISADVDVDNRSVDDVGYRRLRFMYASLQL